jgi:hypothetical protein
MNNKENNELQERVWDTCDEFGPIAVLSEIIQYVDHSAHKGGETHRANARRVILTLADLVRDIKEAKRPVQH